MDKTLALLGLAKKAGRLAVGAEATASAVFTGRARLIVLASDAAINTVRRFKGADTPEVVRLPYGKDELGAAIGCAGCAAAAICDKGFADAFRKALGAPVIKKDTTNHGGAVI